MRLSRICPICGSRAGEDLREIRMVLQRGNPLPKSYHVVCCGCGGYHNFWMEEEKS